MEGGAVGHNFEMGLPDGPLPKLCSVFPTSYQDGCQTKNRKKGGMKF
jgi:hypothetical protein